MCTFQSYILSKCNSNPGNTVYSICDKKLNYANKIIIYEFVNSSGNSSKHLWPEITSFVLVIHVDKKIIISLHYDTAIIGHVLPVELVLSNMLQHLW